MKGEGIETEIFWIGNKPVGGCIACMKCQEKGACVFDDVVNRFREKAYEADGFVFFDFDELILLFYLDYIAIMGLFIFVGNYVWVGLKHIGERKKKVERNTQKGSR